MRTQSFTPLVASLLLVGCSFSETASRSVERTWSATEVRKISLRSLNSTIEIVGSETKQVRLHAEVQLAGPEAKRILKEGPIEFDLKDGVLEISESSYDRSGGVLPFLVRRGRSNIDYRLEVPSSVALSITNVSGSIEVSGMTAETDLQSVNGSIEAVSGGARLTARTVNGPIDARFTDSFAGAKLRTVNGPVDVSVPALAGFVANVSQVNGGFESNIPVMLKRNGNSSTAVIGTAGAHNELEVTTVNGDITLTRSGGGKVLEAPQAPEPSETANVDDDEDVDEDAPKAPPAIPAPPPRPVKPPRI